MYLYLRDMVSSWLYSPYILHCFKLSLHSCQVGLPEKEKEEKLRINILHNSFFRRKKTRDIFGWPIYTFFLYPMNPFRLDFQLLWVSRNCFKYFNASSIWSFHQSLMGVFMDFIECAQVLQIFCCINEDNHLAGQNNLYHNNF